jgi:hypothetical protein
METCEVETGGIDHEDVATDPAPEQWLSLRRPIPAEILLQPPNCARDTTSVQIQPHPQQEDGVESLY